MRWHIALLLLVINFAFATRWENMTEYKGTFNPSWEINPQTKEEVPLFKIGAKAKVGGLGACGIQSNAFYKLAMQLNKDTLQDLLFNWKDLALVGGIYTMATYMPVVKEAMVGAEMMADKIAQLKNLSCQSAMNIMNNYFKRSSDIVRACVIRRLTGKSVSPWGLDAKKVEQILAKAGATEGKIEEAYYYCMNNASLFDAFQGTDLSKWLEKNNLRKWITCNYVSALGMKDLGDRYSMKSTLIKGGDAKTMAQVALLAITPEWVIEKKDKDWILTPKKIEIDGRPATPEYLFELLKQSVDEDFEELIKYAKDGDSDSYYDKVKKMNAKYYIEDEDVLPYFDFLFLGYRALSVAEKKGQYDKIKTLKPTMIAYTEKFKKQYFLLKKQAVEKQMIQLYRKARAKYDAMKVAGKDSFESYCGGK